MANSTTDFWNIAGRYAQALFDLVRDPGGIDALSTQVDELSRAYEDSAELRDLTVSPLYDRRQQKRRRGGRGWACR